ncbi:hypothetical protein CPB85DRAFT_1257229 [Mucidula mucida]|nr:hypothetical protein CPB85DRAFT_1257229 [Mucidula mucida]
MPFIPQPITRAAREHLHYNFLNLQFLTEKAAVTTDDIDIYRKFHLGADQDVHFIRLCSVNDRTSLDNEYELKCCTHILLEVTHASSYRLVISDKVIATRPRAFHQGFLIELFRLAVRCDARVVHVRPSSTHANREVVELRWHDGRPSKIVQMWMCITCSEWHFDETHTHWPQIWCLLYQPDGPGGRLLQEFLTHRPPQ